MFLCVGNVQNPWGNQKLFPLESTEARGMDQIFCKEFSWKKFNFNKNG